MKTVDMTGHRYGRLIVLEIHGSRKSRAKWLCLCDCGNTVIRDGGQLRESGKIQCTQSCGCFKIERIRKLGKDNLTHGHTIGPYRKLYDVWRQMLRRCESPTCKDYPAYGGRGISVCLEWHSLDEFIKWCVNSGWQDGLTIERSDVFDGYHPGNCTWVPNQMQARNTRKVIEVTLGNRTLCLSEWARLTGIHIQTLLGRHRKGWTVERMLTVQPIKGRNQFGDNA